MKEFLVVVIGLSLCLMLFATPPTSGRDAAPTSAQQRIHWITPDGARGSEPSNTSAAVRPEDTQD